MRIAVGLIFGSLIGASALGVVACSSSIKHDNASASGGSSGAIPADATTFHEHVEPLLQSHCQDCHFSGGIAPFALVTYEDAKAQAPAMLQQTKGKSMPPWGALPVDSCKPRLPFAGDNHLSDDQIDIIDKWVSGGSLEGDPAKAPPARTSFGVAGLQGITDTLPTAAAYSVPAALGTDVFRCFVLDPNLDADTWVNGIEVKPGNNLVVHHALVFTDPDRESITKELDASKSYPCFGSAELQNTDLFAAWAPGATAADFKESVAMQIKAKSLLVMQVHYHPRADTDEVDQTVVNLRRAPGEPDYIGSITLFGNSDGTEAADFPIQRMPQADDPASGKKFIIPANSTNHVEDQVLTLPEKISGYPLPELHVLAAGTHAHWVAEDISVNLHRANPTATDPADECLVQTPKWNFNWQRAYWYDAPIEQTPIVRAGDKLTVHCAYNNTMNNPFVVKALSEQHLTQPQDVRLGETTLDEMCLGVALFAYKNPFKN